MELSQNKRRFCWSFCYFWGFKKALFLPSANKSY
ncbi:hypothetical protein BGL55_05505 [Helicobacter pylori]|nr:hypothetical protein BGL55_05505 [Helicobacter pylori]